MGKLAAIALRFSALASPRTLWLALGCWFIGTIGLAAALFPRHYDWQHIVISSLASPRDNPSAYGIACAGLAGTGLLLIPFAAILRERFAPFAPKTVALAGKLFLLGAVGLVLSALIVPGRYHVLGIAHTHEHLAQICSAAFCLSLLLYFTATRRLPAAFARLRLAVAIVAVLPLSAFLANRIALLLTFAYSNADNYRAMKATYWSNLALWEWIAVLSLYLFLGLIIFSLKPPASKHSE